MNYLLCAQEGEDMTARLQNPGRTQATRRSHARLRSLLVGATAAAAVPLICGALLAQNSLQPAARGQVGCGGLLRSTMRAPGLKAASADYVGGVDLDAVGRRQQRADSRSSIRPGAWAPSSRLSKPASAAHPDLMRCHQPHPITGTHNSWPLRFWRQGRVRAETLHHDSGGRKAVA